MQFLSPGRVVAVAAAGLLLAGVLAAAPAYANSPPTAQAHQGTGELAPQSPRCTARTANGWASTTTRQTATAPAPRSSCTEARSARLALPTSARRHRPSRTTRAGVCNFWCPTASLRIRLWSSKGGSSSLAVVARVLRHLISVRRRWKSAAAFAVRPDPTAQSARCSRSRSQSGEALRRAGCGRLTSGWVRRSCVSQRSTTWPGVRSYFFGEVLHSRVGSAGRCPCLAGSTPR